jgi:hypothetical protein
MYQATATSPVNSSVTTFAKMSMEDVLDDEKGRKTLKEFMAKCSIPESLTFLEMIEEYTLLKSHNNRFKKAQEIMDKFIQQGALSEINISQVTRTKVVQAFEKATPTYCDKRIFEDCSTEVMLQLKNDVWPRFLNSEEGKRLMGLAEVDEYTDELSTKENAKKVGIDFTTPYLSDTEINMINEWAYTDLKFADTEWKLISNKDGIKSFVSKKSVKFSDKTSETKMWNVESYFEEPAELVLRAAFTAPLRLENDGYLVDIKHLEYHPYDVETDRYAYTVTSDLYKFPFMTYRVFNMAGAIREETFSSKKWQRFLAFRKSFKIHSVQKISFDKVKQYIPVDCISLRIFEQANDSNTLTRALELGWIDMKGNVPKWLWNKLIAGRGAGYFEGLRKSIQKYKTLMEGSEFPNIDSYYYLDTLRENRERKGIIHYE